MIDDNSKGFLQVNNQIIDYWMSKLTNAEFKTLLAIIRKTKGWNKPYDRISQSQMAELTGLTTRSIRIAIDGLLSKNLIIVTGDEKKVKLFAVNFTAVNDVETDVTAMELALKNAEVISKDKEVISHDAEVISKDKEAYFLHNKQTKDTNTKDTNTKDTNTKDTNTKEKKDSQKTKSKNKFELVKPDDVSDEVWNDLLSHRKSKKVSNTQTAWKMIFNQLAIAKEKSGHSSEQIISEWLARDWKGFKADWYLNTVQQPTRNNQGLQDAKQSKLNELEQYINSYGTEQEVRNVN